MNPDLILLYSNGQSQETALFSPFDPDENEIAVHSPKGEARIPLPALCGVLMKRLPSSLPEPRAHLLSPDIAESVETVSGKQFRIMLIPKPEFDAGIFGVNLDPESSFRYAFFPFHGIRPKDPESALGEIFSARGLATPDDFQALMEEPQEDSREKGTPEEVKEGERGEARTDARIGSLLVEEGLLTQNQLLQALTIQKREKNKKIGSILIEKGMISQDQLLQALARKFRLNYVNLASYRPDEKLRTVLPADLIHRMQVLPVDNHPDRLVVAIANPTDHMVTDNLRFVTNRRVEVVIAQPSQITAMINRYFPVKDQLVKDIIGDVPDKDLSFEEPDLSDYTESDSRIIQLTNQILIDAYHKGASDIHFEPGIGQKPFRVRYRIDGVCSQAHTIPASYKRAIVSRIKIMSNLDISERRKPQSGKIQIKFHQQVIEYRVEITPTISGNEDCVLRILTSAKPMPLTEMDFSAANLRRLSAIITKPYGIVLCVGPTGSGKTTTLHACLGHINEPDRKIWTAEDPVEITQEGLRQVQVNPKIGYTFQEALRSFLRADPDVIMIGEMRDLETAKIAVESSLTGHLVFSTLHTNSAPETVVRLMEMGIDPLNFSDALLGVMAQRLARRLCTTCRTPYHLTESEYSALVHAYGKKLFEADGLPDYTEELVIMKRVGCERCGGTGYLGRVAVHELLMGTENVKKAVRRRMDMDEIRDIAIREGMRTLRMDGIQKVFKGLTDFRQVLKVCI